MKDRLKKIWARKGLRWLIIIVIAVVLGWLLVGKNNNVTYETAQVARGTVTESVTATGQVKPEQYASLRFKIAGAIGRLSADVGDTVAAGEVLASLDVGDLSRKLTQAEADLVSAEVSLANAEQEVADQKTRGAQALSVLYDGAPNTLNEILNLVQQQYASFITFYDTTGHLTPSIASSILISQRVVDADNARGPAETAAQFIASTLENFPAQPDKDRIDAALAAIHAPLQQLQASLGAVINAVASVPSGLISATTLAAYKDTLAAARTNINSAITKESTLVSDIRDARVQNELSLNSAIASERSARANVEKSKAAVEIARQNLSDAYLRAPIAGTIAVRSKQLGELVTTSEQVYYIIGQGGLEIISNIPEIDIAKIQVGNTANVQFDAYGKGVTFAATVTEIDPAETVIDGIATYRVKFKLVDSSVGVRSGMTADISIVTAQKENVLKIPLRAIRSIGGRDIVRIPSGESFIEQPVTLGLRSSDGSVEIVGGLDEGAVLIVSTN